MLTVQITLDNSDGNAVQITELARMSLPSRTLTPILDEQTIDAIVLCAVARLKAAACAGSVPRVEAPHA